MMRSTEMSMDDQIRSIHHKYRLFTEIWGMNNF